jgi:hypothetical protein
MSPFRHDGSLTDGGEGRVFVESDARLLDAQLEARRKRQREHARLKRRTDPEWVARRNEAQRKYRSKALGTKDENPHDPRLPPEHGTPQRYSRLKCRCPRCKMANRDKMRVYRTGDMGPEENLR